MIVVNCPSIFGERFSKEKLANHELPLCFGDGFNLVKVLEL